MKRRGTLLRYLLRSLSLLDFVFHHPCIPFEAGKGSFSWCSACVELVLGLSLQPSTFSSSECVVADLTAPVIQQSYAAVFFTEGTGWRARISPVDNTTVSHEMTLRARVNYAAGIEGIGVIS